MLIGEYESNIGAKNRVALPKKFRDEFNSEDLIITRGYEKCLIIVDQSRWKKLIKSIEVRPLLNASVRDLKRYLVGGAQEITTDSQGRFVINSTLMDFSKLDKKVVFVGIEDWVEIWDLGKWKEKIEELNENIEDLADRLSNLK